MNKKIKVLVIMAIYIGLMLLGTKVYGTNATTINSTTRLRREASTKSGTIELIEINQTVEIVSKEGDWYKVKHKLNGVTYTGYIRADMLKVEENNSTTNENQTNQQQPNNENTSNQEETTNEQNNNEENNEVQIEIKENDKIKLKNNVEMKILPLINSSKTGEFLANSEVTITEIIGKWCYLQNENESGWVMKSKVSIETENTQEKQPTQEDNKEKENENKESEKEVTNNKDTNTTTEKKTTTLYVSTTTVNLREKAETNSKILKQLVRNTKVTVVEVIDKTWTKVKVSNVTGYVASKYLSEKQTSEVTSRASQETRTSIEEQDNQTNATETNKTVNETQTNNTSNTEKETTSKETKTETSKTTTTKKEQVTTSNKTSSSSSKGSEIVAYAKKYLGCKYVSGGTSPKGFDCSGFTQYVYKHFGYSISRTSSAQRSNGKAVKKSELQQGDIVCFSGHVGIYIGGNKFIHAANPKKGVIITSLSDSYYVKNYITARRII